MGPNMHCRTSISVFVQLLAGTEIAAHSHGVYPDPSYPPDWLDAKRNTQGNLVNPSILDRQWHCLCMRVTTNDMSVYTCIRLCPFLFLLLLAFSQDLTLPVQHLEKDCNLPHPVLMCWRLAKGFQQVEGHQSQG